MLKNLKKLREEKGISQKQLADVVSVSQQSINKYENHNIEPDIDTLIKMADYFETSVDYIIGHSKIRRKIEAVRKINNKRANGYSGAVGLTLFKTTKKLICLFDTV